MLGNIGDDTFTGTSATIAAADIVNGGDGNDTLNVTLTATNAQFTVSNVETINADWDAFGTAGFDATNVTGATINLTSDKTGFLGSATVTAAGGNTVVAGSGIDGTLTVNGITTGTVTGGEAATVVANSAATAASDDVITLTAGASTATITVADFNSGTVNAGTATTINVTDDDAAADESDSLTLNIGASATITNNVDDLTLNATAGGLTATINAVDAALVIGGDFDVNLAVTDLLSYTAEAITGNIGTVTAGSVSAATDLTDSEATSYVIEGANHNLTLNSGTTVTLEADGGANSAFAVGAAGGSDVLNLVIEADQTALESDAETTNITISATAVAAAADVTLTTLIGGEDYVFAATSNDFNVDGVVASDVNASAVTGAFDLDQGAAAALDVTGSATAANTISFSGTTHTNNYIGGSANDTIDAATTSGSLTAVVNNGTNSVTANSLTTGNLVVNGGTGADSVTAAAITDANITLELSDGANEITFGTVGNAVLDDATIVVVTGSGNDTITLNEDFTANTSITVNMGTGTNTLVLDASGDISLGTQSFTGVTTLDMTGGGAASTVAASLVSGTTINVKATNTAGDIFTVVGTTAAGETIDMSGLVMDQSITDAVVSTSITGNAGADTISGTAIADAIASNGGADTIDGNGGADVITLGGGAEVIDLRDSVVSAADDVNSFATGTDSLKVGVAANALNYSENDAAHASAAAAVTAADTAFAANTNLQVYVAVDVSGATEDSWAVIDTDGDGDGDLVFSMDIGTIATLADIDSSDFIA